MVVTDVIFFQRAGATKGIHTRESAQQTDGQFLHILFALIYFIYNRWAVLIIM